MNHRESMQLQELAKIYYLDGMESKIIAEKVGVSEQTISSWKSKGNWSELRAARNVTRPELVNKMLRSIDKLLDETLLSDDPSAIATMADRLSKLAAVVQKLDKKAGAVETIEVMTAFSKWLGYRMQTDPELTPERMKMIQKYLDLFVSEQVTSTVR
ncbi:MAG: terminase [Marinilabiliaceae bacterium]|nr:terminase [Marinilabiliaceae bacterium]